MTTIIIGNTYTLNIEELRTIDLRGRECIASRIDNIRKFLNALIDDILVHHKQLTTSVVCYYDYQTFSISLKESYPFIQKHRMPVIFKFNCDIDNVTSKVISDIIENCCIDTGDTTNKLNAFVYKSINILNASLFFNAVKVFDEAFYCNEEILNKLLKFPFNPFQKNNVKTSLFEIECGGENFLSTRFNFGPFSFSIRTDEIVIISETKRFSFLVRKSNFNNDVTLFKLIFKNLYDHYSPEFSDIDYEDFVALFKMKYI